MIKFIKRLFRKTLVLDLNALPQQYKTGTKVSIAQLKKYEGDFNINVVLIDASPQNTKSTNSQGIIIKKI